MDYRNADGSIAEMCGNGIRVLGHFLVTHADVDMVSLTGSVQTGKWIAKAAADTLKRVHLELGGKAPVVVFDDVDLETALETIAGTGYYNAGQDCTAATRVLAGSKIHDDFVSGLIEQAARRMNEMIGTLLDFTQLRFRGSLPVVAEEIDLDELLKEA